MLIKIELNILRWLIDGSLATYLCKQQFFESLFRAFDKNMANTEVQYYNVQRIEWLKGLFLCK